MYSSFGQLQTLSKDQKPGWWYVKCDDGIADYYLSFLKLQYPKIQKPMNGCHLTVIAGEKEDYRPDDLISQRFHGSYIEFQYDNAIYFNGRAFWLEAESRDAERVREVCGLPPQRIGRGFHITIGNIKNVILSA